MKLISLALIPFFAYFPSNAATQPDNIGGFPEYYCGSLFSERYIGAPASVSGDKSMLQECAKRFVLAGAIMNYGEGVKYQGIISQPKPDSPDMNSYVFRIQTRNGKMHSFFIEIQVDSTHNAPDGYPAIIVTPTPLGVCEGTNVDACG